MTRVISKKELCHERLGDRFESALSDYDTNRRLEVLIDEFLSGAALDRKSAIDVGCGLGYFSRRLRDYGASVVACDLGQSLVDKTAAFADCHAVQADCLKLADEFGEEQFDVVVSSECIEHTPNPQEAVRQMIRVLKPGGLIAISTPNVVWYPVVSAATHLRLRPFDGLENFSSWSGLRGVFRDNQVEILREKGLHLFPFQLPFHRLSHWCDESLQALRGVMINICILGRKQQHPPSNR